MHLSLGIFLSSHCCIVCRKTMGEKIRVFSSQLWKVFFPFKNSGKRDAALPVRSDSEMTFWPIHIHTHTRTHTVLGIKDWILVLALPLTRTCSMHLTFSTWVPSFCDSFPSNVKWRKECMFFLLYWVVMKVKWWYIRKYYGILLKLYRNGEILIYMYMYIYQWVIYHGVISMNVEMVIF